MSTRSFVAIVDASLPFDPSSFSFKGRYIHSDGYPSGVGRDLVNLVKRDGFERVVQVLTEEHYGWSNLGGSDLGWGRTDGRFESVPDYGVAYTTEKGQTSPDEWYVGHITGDNLDVFEAGSWLEYGYVLTENGIFVIDLISNKVKFLTYGETSALDRDGWEGVLPTED